MDDAVDIKAADAVMPTPHAPTNQIMGYGKVIEVLVGKDADGNPATKKYHLTPVSLADIPNLIKDIDLFMSEFEKEGAQPFSGTSMDAICSAIHMSMKRMHPDVSRDTIMQEFSLGLIALAVEVILDMNDFLSQMATVTSKMKDMKT